MLFAPDPGGPEVSLPGADKAVHLLLFALLAATARWRCGPLPAVAVALAAYAVLSEVAQGLLLADRSGDPVDVLADLAGAAAGWALLSTRPGARSGAPAADPRA